MTDAIGFLSYLTGTWHLERAVSDGKKLQGLAHIRPTNVRRIFRYREEGSFVNSGTTQNAYRDYIYKVKGDRLNILFADPHRVDQLYVSLDFAGSLIANDTHLCGADIYAVVFEIINGNEFHTETYVSGPQKDYRLMSQYQRF